MKKVNAYLTQTSFLILVLGLNSCVSFKPNYGKFAAKSSSEDVDYLFQEAYKLESTSASAESLLSLIDAFKKVEQADPENYVALWKIAHYNILMGAAYAEKAREKKRYYRQAIGYCEKAMSVNKEFMNEIGEVKSVTDAFGKLSINEVDAMGNWYTARFYYFKECLKPFGRVVNTKIVVQNNLMIDRIDELDKDWAGGGNYFSRALYYIAVPEKFGGSKERASDEFSAAIEVGPNYLRNRWGRAKYLYGLTGNQEGFKADLEWVVMQNPRNAGNDYSWNVYFQEDARKMLDGIK